MALIITSIYSRFAELDKMFWRVNQFYFELHFWTLTCAYTHHIQRVWYTVPAIMYRSTGERTKATHWNTLRNAKHFHFNAMQKWWKIMPTKMLCIWSVEVLCRWRISESVFWLARLPYKCTLQWQRIRFWMPLRLYHPKYYQSVYRTTDKLIVCVCVEFC